MGRHPKRATIFLDARAATHGRDRLMSPKSDKHALRNVLRDPQLLAWLTSDPGQSLLRPFFFIHSTVLPDKGLYSAGTRSARYPRNRRNKGTLTGRQKAKVWETKILPVPQSPWDRRLISTTSTEDTCRSRDQGTIISIAPRGVACCGSSAHTSDERVLRHCSRQGYLRGRVYCEAYRVRMHYLDDFAIART